MLANTDLHNHPRFSCQSRETVDEVRQLPSSCFAPANISATPALSGTRSFGTHSSCGRHADFFSVVTVVAILRGRWSLERSRRLELDRFTREWVSGMRVGKAKRERRAVDVPTAESDCPATGSFRAKLVGLKYPSREFAKCHDEFARGFRLRHGNNAEIICDWCSMTARPAVGLVARARAVTIL